MRQSPEHSIVQQHRHWFAGSKLDGIRGILLSQTDSFVVSKQGTISARNVYPQKGILRLNLNVLDDFFSTLNLAGRSLGTLGT